MSVLRQNSTEKVPSPIDTLPPPPSPAKDLACRCLQTIFGDPGKIVATLSDLTSIPDFAIMHLQYASVIFPVTISQPPSPTQVPVFA